MYIMQKTVILTKNGDPEGVSQLDQDQISRLKGKTFQNGADKIGVVDTQQTVSEEVQQGDYQNLARQIGKGVATALRDHGDEVAFLTARSVSEKGCTIHVQYKPDERGEVWEDDFRFTFDQNYVYLEGEKISEIHQASGTLVVQNDLIQDALTRFIDEKTQPGGTGEEKQAQQSNEIEECGNLDLVAEFKSAVEAYREDPNRETIKNLLRHARGFEGDTILHKFRNAVKAYKGSYGSDGLEEPAETPEGIEPESVLVPQEEQPCSEECDMRLDTSLFIRLLEYSREDAKADVDLHYVAENLQRICKEKGCATMEDYESIISSSSQEGDKAEAEEKDEEV